MEYRASHILVSDRTLAQDLSRKAKQGADFASLAREFSTCPSKSSGG
ncbi:MAG: peptidylprolyl isomerase, partial [Spirochaetes bacterium]|nr:peptidylprolyl isomerase [Spirochaetota bacterium]